MGSLSSAEALDQRIKMVYGPLKWEKVPGKRLVIFCGCVCSHHRDLNGMGRLCQRRNSYLDCRDGAMINGSGSPPSALFCF